MNDITPRSTMIPPITVDSREAARLLSISERLLHQMKQDGSVPYVKANSKVLYNVESLRQWSKAQEIGGSDE